MSRVTKVLAAKASPLSPWALSRVQRASSHLLILHPGHTEVLRDCGKNLRLFLTVRSLVFSNLSQDKMPISSLHPVANLPICLWRAPAALCLTFLSYVFTQCSIFVTFYFILVFSAATVKSIKKSDWRIIGETVSTIIPGVREEGNRTWSCFVLLRNTWINPNFSSKLNWRSGIEEETRSYFIPCRLEIRVNHSWFVNTSHWHTASSGVALGNVQPSQTRGCGSSGWRHLSAASPVGCWSPGYSRAAQENTATALSIREMSRGEELNVPTAKRLI